MSERFQCHVNPQGIGLGVVKEIYHKTPGEKTAHKMSDSLDRQSRMNDSARRSQSNCLRNMGITFRLSK
jgi:hypothetical protein